LRKVLTAIAASIACLPAGAARAGDDTERIRRAVDHTLSTQLPNGLFEYDFDFLAGESTGEDNIVRQAGTLFALGEYLVDVDDARVVPVMRAGLEALAERSLPLGRGSIQAILEWTGIFSIESGRLERALRWGGLLYDPGGDGRVVSGDDAYDNALTGATALALIAELHYQRATGDDRYRDLRESWLRGLLALHVSGRGVRAHPATLFENPYVNGEAWVTLAYYHELFPEDERVARALDDLESYVMDRYGREPDRNFYHWGAIAGAIRFRSGGDEHLSDFAAQQAETMLETAPPEKTRKQTTCSLIEGLAASIAVLRSSAERGALVSRMRERVGIELARNRALQIRPGQDRWELGGGALLKAPALGGYAGAFVAGPYRIYTRTDITQHCISALLKVRRLGAEELTKSIPPGEDRP